MADAREQGTPVEEPVTPLRLVRDRVTVALYASFVTWGWFVYSFPPAVPLLADELGITRAQAGLHGTALAVGTIVSGALNSWLAIRLGRRRVLVLGALVVAVGVAGLTLGASLAVTLPAAFVTALGGSLTISASQAALAVHHGESSAAAVTEANGVAALAGIVAPLVLGGVVAAEHGWQPAVAVAVPLAVVAAALQGSLPGRGALGVPERTPVRPAGSRAGFSRAFWLFWATLVGVVAIENATTYWSTDLLRTQTGATSGVAAGSLTALVGGMCVSRFVVGRLALRRSAPQLLLVAFGVAAAGWLVLWNATTAPVAIVGLVIAGLGYGAHYPLSIALVMGASEGRPDQAQARGTLAVGVALGVAPFLLGALADRFGTHTAFLLVPVLIAAGTVALLLGVRAERRLGTH